MDLTAEQIRAATIRLFAASDSACFSEFTLKSGRRIDLICLSRSGVISAVEIKSSVADFRADEKWSAYLDWADYFYFAVSEDFPLDILPDPEQAGIIITDGFEAVFHRAAPHKKLAGARRNSLTRQMAMRAMRRATTLSGQDDPLQSLKK